MKNDIVTEQLFPYEGMSLEERDFYLNVLLNCRDICDTKFKMGNNSKCDVIQLGLKKEFGVVRANGFLTISDQGKHENRCIEADIFHEKEAIIVDMKITRLCVSDTKKVYRVIDEFTINEEKIQRWSKYNDDMRSTTVMFDSEEMKGKIK